MEISQTLELIIRLAAASLIGAAIGFERKYRAKGAGIGTHVLVAIGSALFMVVSQYGFAGAARFDAARVAAGVVSGIGFLGGGIILKQQNRVSGLTTAAGLWVTSAMGLAVGSGMYVVGVSAAVIVLAWIDIVNRLTRRIGRRQITVTFQSDKQESLIAAIQTLGKSVESYSLSRSESGYKVEAILNVAQKTYSTELLPQLTSIPDVKLDKIE